MHSCSVDARRAKSLQDPQANSRADLGRTSLVILSAEPASGCIISEPGDLPVFE